MAKTSPNQVSKRRNKRKNKPRKITRVRVKSAKTVPRFISSVGVGKSSTHISTFKRALRDPFDPLAYGARVCDAYSMPSIAYHHHLNVSCTSSAGGLWAGVFFPSPCLSLICSEGSASGLTAFTQNLSTYYCDSPSQLAAYLSEYRTVAWGIRIVPKDTAFSAKGRITVATVPTTENAPAWNTVETITATSDDVISAYSCGLATPTSLDMTLPTVKVFSVQDLLRGQIVATGVPSHASFYEYKGLFDRSNLAWAAGTYLADEVVTSGVNLVNATAAGRKDPAKLTGGTAIRIYASGLPAATNEFDIELIYHLEGIPPIIGAGLYPSSITTTKGSSSLVESVLAAAHSAGSLIKMAAGEMLGGTSAVSFLTDVAGAFMRKPPLRITG